MLRSYAIPEALVVVSEDNVILYASRRLYGMFGYVADELIGQSMLNLIPRSVRDSESDRMAEYVKNPRPLCIGLNGVVYGQRKDGSQFRFVLLIDFGMTSKGKIFSILIRDFSAELETRSRFSSAWHVL